MTGIILEKKQHGLGTIYKRWEDKMKTIFVLVDALKSKYLNDKNMPFLYSFSKNGRYIEKIIPSAGFCERCEIFSGLDCFNTGNFTAIGYDPDNSPYANENIILGMANLISKVNYKLAKYLLRKYRDKKGISLKPYRIPIRSLNRFCLTEDGTIQRIAYRTIFNVLDENNMKYTLDGFTSLADNPRHRKLTSKELVEREIYVGTDFIPVYIGEIDHFGHKYGSDIESMKPYLRSVDEKLKELYDIAIRNNYNFAVLGDHGMVPIDNYVNIHDCLRDCRVTLHKDYEMFVDSTVVRFWFFNERARKDISDTINNKLSNYGIIVDRLNCIKYRIPLDIMVSDGKPLYGDLVWCANSGILLVPDYFNPEYPKYKGMHGYYDINMEEGTGLFVSTASSRKSDKCFLKDVCGELCDLLEVGHPNSKEWERSFYGAI